ncbi:hypothetical protein [Legionella longbeachae]|uniref:SidC N-terminal domain-containing protein n=1 Tax=Legionella longbeachae serogroup 1 (strain NSW150) TaxID=661367 RepID=D3HR10_LEGLN|nr:hypothetical protein [Legionella longbeachae]VEE01845.1 SidC homolog [Legionella oakridgensis]HBD7399346.1 hypothetical protein [Legionella pneumophila]ARB91837.1 hypothetical protein A6J40_06400 [Legionella longbeachae]EEZ95565.1 hypothetical protein LLB_0741 [Legionella longbeachae D-4968]QEY50968.1 hypothetical protein FQU71_06755 [Legionella longbeachae]
MYISSNEPTAPRYIHINPQTNKVHLLVPISYGDEINHADGCDKTTAALQDLFNREALDELDTYQHTLQLDIQLLDEGSEQRIAKEERLIQSI